MNRHEYGYLDELNAANREQRVRGEHNIRLIHRRVRGRSPVWPHWEAGVAAPCSPHCTGQGGRCLGGRADADCGVSEAREDRQPTLPAGLERQSGLKPEVTAVVEHACHQPYLFR